MFRWQFSGKSAKNWQDMHGQHENQTLLKPEPHLAGLDLFNADTGPVLTNYQLIYNEWLGIKKQLDKLNQDYCLRAQRQDTLKWQVEEITAAGLQENGDVQLEKELKNLANAEKIAGSVSRATAYLDSEGQISVLAVLNNIKRELDAAAKFMPQLEQYSNVISDIIYQLKDVSCELAKTAEELECQPNRLDYIQKRLDVIYRLKKKYGQTFCSYFRILCSNLPRA